MGDEKKTTAVASIKPKRVKARRRPDGSLEILEEVKTPEEEVPKPQDLDSFSFSDRDALKDELLKEQRSGTYGRDGKLDIFGDDND
jgi:hypothetical protein